MAEDKKPRKARKASRPGTLQRAPNRLTLRQVETALRASAGIQSLAAQKLKVSPPTLCRFIQRHPKLDAVIDEIVNEVCDIAVVKLMEKIKQGDVTAIRYYLDNKGQSHGFGQRKLAFKDGDGNVMVPGVLITSGKMSEEEWQRRYGKAES
jgi:hypothetical protein